MGARFLHLAFQGAVRTLFPYQLWHWLSANVFLAYLSTRASHFIG